MKKVLYLLIALLFSGSMIAQPTINGDISDTEYTTIGTYTSGNDGFGGNNDLGVLKAYYSNGTLHIGLSGELENNDNIVVFLNFSGYAGLAAGSTLNAGSNGVFNSTGLDNAIMDMEVDFAFAFNEGSGSTNFYLDAARYGTTGCLGSVYIGSCNQSGTSATISNNISTVLGGTGSITMAYNNSYASNTDKGVEFSIPLSAFAGVSNTATLQVFAIISSNTGYLSNECIPGNPGGSNLGNDADLTAIGSQDLFTSPFTMGSQPGNALNFDGSNDYVVIPDNSALDFTSTYTIEANIYVEAYQYGTIVAKFDDDSDNRGYMINMGETGDNSKLCVINSTLNWGTHIQWNTGFTPSLNTWYHIAITYDQTLGSNNLKLYVDGSFYSQTNYSTVLPNNAANLYIGGYDNPGNGVNGGANGRFFNGRIDEVRLWNTTRTQEQILENMYTELEGTETGLVAYYNCDFGIGGGTNTSVSNLYDNGQNGNTGTLTGFALSGATSNWVESGARLVDNTTALSYIGAGNALTFDGSNDYVAIPDAASLDLSSGAFSIEFWAKPSVLPSVTSYGWVVSKDNGNADVDYLVGLVISDKWFFGARNLDVAITGSTVISTNNWYHVACIFDGTTAYLYINGVLEGSDNTVGSGHLNTSLLLLGARRPGPTEFFNGLIDEVRIWNDARTGAEIRANMFARLNGNEANLAAYYTFDATSGTTLTDKTSNANNGTLTNMAGTEWASSSAREAAKAVTTGGNWNTASTWLKGSVPNASTKNVEVLSNITLDTDVAVNHISVTNGDTLTIGNTYELTTSGNVLNDGVVTIENTGALIQGSSSDLGNSGTFNINKSATPASGALRYDFWGSPVTSANVSILGALGGNRYWYNPAAATTDLALGWTAASGTMVVGRGYIATNSGDVTFTGTVNNGEITYAAITETNSSVNIENIISNPYPSGLDLTLFAAANVSASQLTSSFYFWDDKGTAGNYGTDGYATFNSSGATWTAAGFAGASAIPSNNIIASGQGFVVVPGASAPASFNVTFTNSMRAANTSTFYRDGSDRQRFWVQLTKDSTHFSEMAVVVNSDATESYDEQYDSKRLDANNSSTSINAYYDNTLVVIKSLPAFSSRKQVPLTINIAGDGMYKFAVSKSDNIDGLKIFLFDNLTGMAHLISNNNEHLQLLTVGSYFDRFYLVFDEVENAGTAIEEVHSIQYSVTPRDIILTNINEPMSYEVYSLNGQLLEQANLTTNSIDLSTYSTGIYLVKLKTASATKTIKFARH